MRRSGGRPRAPSPSGGADRAAGRRRSGRLRARAPASRSATVRRVRDRAGPRSCRAARHRPRSWPGTAGSRQPTVAALLVEACVRTQRAGSSPGVRTRFEVRLGCGGGVPSPVSARTRSVLPLSPATIQTRSSPAASRTRSAMSGAASAVEVAVASDRLSANKLFASDARLAASSARACWIATRRPTTSATNRNSTRSSNSLGSAMTIEKRGSVNRKS